MNENILLLSALGAIGLYLYSIQEPTQSQPAQDSNASSATQDPTTATQDPTTATQDPTTVACPDGTVQLADNSCCVKENVQADGTCGACPWGSQASTTQDGNPVCCPTANLGTDGICQQCPIGSSISADGSSCVDNNASSGTSGNPLNVPTTGNVYGDMAVQAGIGITAGIVMDKALDKTIESFTKTTAQDSAKLAVKEVAQQTAEKVAKETAEAIAEKTAKEAGELIAKKTVAKSAQAFATRIATKVGTKLAMTFARASTEASTVVGIPLAIFDLMLTAIDIALVQALSLDGDSFEPNGANQFSLSDLPDWATTLLGSIPYIGSIIDILSAPIVSTAGCGNGKEEQNGLCYDPARPGWQCEAFLCYKDYPDFENNGMLHTRQNITKKMLTDTGTVPDTCPAGQIKSGGFCYADPGQGWSVVAGTAWASCPSNYTDTGALCDNTLSVGVGRIPDKAPCDDGQRDDGTSCWEDYKAHCRLTSLSLVDDSCFSGCGCVKKTLMDRQTCADNEDMISGLCYPKCPNGLSRQPGGLLCGGTVPKASQVLSPLPLQCGDGKVDGSPWGSAGLCYTSSIPDGYQRQTAGLLSQICPPGAPDIGVGCQRETYTRSPTVALTMGIRDRKHQQVDRTPMTCSQTGLEDPADLQACQSMLCLPDEDIASGNGQDFCVSRCRDSYQPGVGGLCIRPAGGTDINGNPFVADQYQRRPPMVINWGGSGETPTVSLSDWASFSSSNATEVATTSINSSMGTMVGKWMNAPTPVQKVVVVGAMTVSIAEEAGYTKMVASDGTAKYYIGSINAFDATQWGSYTSVPVGNYSIQY